MPLHAEATIYSGFRGLIVIANTSESSIIPSRMSFQLAPASVVLYARHHVPAYIVLASRGSIASESMLTGIVAEEIFFQLAPESFEIQAPSVVPATRIEGSVGD